MLLWSKVAPCQVLVERWHVSHSALVWMWLAFLPVAIAPLWQLLQGWVTELWSNPAPSHVLVERWQVSHSPFVAICVADLPVAIVPLWQLLQGWLMPL